MSLSQPTEKNDTKYDICFIKNKKKSISSQKNGGHLEKWHGTTIGGHFFSKTMPDMDSAQNFTTENDCLQNLFILFPTLIKA